MRTSQCQVFLPVVSSFLLNESANVRCSERLCVSRSAVAGLESFCKNL